MLTRLNDNQDRPWYPIQARISDQVWAQIDNQIGYRANHQVVYRIWDPITDQIREHVRILFQLQLKQDIKC